jgi:Carboxypeptidase regulatory-like domain
VLSLVPEAPIHGRVVDGEGRPVAGVRVRVREQAKPTEGKDLGPWLEAVKMGLMTADRKTGDQLPAYEDDASPPIVSDRDGRFTVPGVGAERLVRLELSGGTIATARVDVVNREMTPIARTAGIDAPSEVFGKDFAYHASPTRPIVGTVRDADTGKPVAGVSVESEFRDDLRTETDEQGKFRLVGLPSTADAKAGRKNLIRVLPGNDQPYFPMNWIDVPQPAGHEPVTLDAKLRRGLWITGRVTDKVTGKPVLAHVHYFPYASNPLVTKQDWSKLGDFNDVMIDSGRHITRPDGSYRILGLPTRGIVGARALSGTYRKGTGASEIPGMQPDGQFPTLGSPVAADARREDALKEINPPRDSKSVTCDLTLDPGGKVRLTVVDGAGKPVDNTSWIYSSGSGSVVGLSSESTFEVAGMSPTESRTYVISQRQRKIARLFTLEYENKPSRALTITLEPCATVKGRLVDEKGAPLKNVEVRPSAMRKGRWLLDLHTSSGYTDADGHFICRNLAVGCDSYSLEAYWDQGYANVAVKLEITAGKTIDLGEVKLRAKQ